MKFGGLFTIIVLVCLSIASAADWPTYRGNAERTGNIDGQPGPTKPRVIWSIKGADNFVGSPAVMEKVVGVAALGAFNSGRLVAFDPSADQFTVKWKKEPPLLKLPVVSSPICVGGTVVFGDGMHQTDGAALRGVDAATGQLLWQHSVPGNLVHMEGAALASGERLYVGAGHAGVICLNPSRLTSMGAERSAAEIREMLARQWQELLAKYEKEKKVDPDFAVPPSEDSLPKATPQLVWQVGVNAWHVDAPLALAGKQLLAASAYLDVEKSGERALVCLDADSGDVQWKTPLELNPWAGATVAGDLVILGCSNIRLDPKEIRRGRGQLVALNLSDGKVAWKKIVPGGIVSSVAVSDGLAIACATDGKVRAYDLAAKGNVRWTYDAEAPLFAGPAVVGKTAYVGDLKGVVHAVSLENGNRLWQLDLKQAVGLKNPSIYGAPAVHGGRIYLGTCQLETAGAGEQALVCIGE
jgi:outer membrane protein assembly factor BamB